MIQFIKKFAAMTSSQPFSKGEGHALQEFLEFGTKKIRVNLCNLSADKAGSWLT